MLTCREREKEAFSVRNVVTWAEQGVPKPPTEPKPFHLSTAETAVAMAAAHRAPAPAPASAPVAGRTPSPRADVGRQRPSGEGTMHPAAQRALLQRALESDGTSFLHQPPPAAGPNAAGSAFGGGGGVGGRRAGPRSPARAGEVTMSGPGIDITHYVGGVRV
jgi:hypothetical protein